jgi:hypothetical protein
MADDPDTSLPSGTPERGQPVQDKLHVIDTKGDSITARDVSGTGIAIGPGATAIVTIYQQILRPVPYPFRAGVQRMIEDYTEIFGGRDTELSQLDDFLTQDERPFALLLAPTGRGKTALLIHWIARIQQIRPEWRVIFAPISIRYQTASEQAILGLLAYSLAEIHNDLEQFRSYDQSSISLRAIVADYLRRSLPENAHLLVVIDGLDEAIGWTITRELFPHSPDSHLKLVVAARELAHSTRSSWHHNLGFAPRRTCNLTLKGLNKAAVRDILQFMGSPLDTLATDINVLSEIERLSQGDPVIVRLLVELLLDKKILPGQLVELPQDDLNAVFELWLNTLREHERTHERVYALLSLVATALGPITTDDLLALEDIHLRSARDVEDAARAVARFVIGDGSQERGYVFSHQKLREVYCEQRIGKAQQALLQQRFVQYGKRWYIERNRSLTEYLRQFWVEHLKEAQEWLMMRQVLAEIAPTSDGKRRIQPWADIKYRSEGSYAGYLANLEPLWNWAERENDIALFLRCAFIYASIRSQSNNLTPELLVALITIGTLDGKWSPIVALEHIAQMADSGRQVASMEHLLASGVILPWARALEVAQDIGDQENRARMLAILAPYLPSELLPTALYVASTNGNYSYMALDALAPYLPPELLPPKYQNRSVMENQFARLRSTSTINMPFIQQPATVSVALQTASAINDNTARARVLTVLAPSLPLPHQSVALNAALQAASAINDNIARAQVLTVLAPSLLSPHQSVALNAALQAVSDIEYEFACAEALTALAPHLLPELLPAAFQTASAISDNAARAWALTGLAPKLLRIHQLAALSTALQATSAIEYEFARAPSLSALAPHLLPELLSAAFQIASAIENEFARAWALTSLVPHLSPELLLSALQTASEISDGAARAWVLTALAPHLLLELLPRAVQVASAIESEFARAWALTALAPQLRPANREAVLNAAFQAASAIDNNTARIEALAALIPHMPSAQQPAILNDALRTLTAMKGDITRADLLIALVPHLLADSVPNALQIASTIKENTARSYALIALASRLSPLQQPPTLNAAFEAISAIESDFARAEALAALVPHLLPELLPAALQVASFITDEKNRADVLHTLAQHLVTRPDNSFQQLTAILRILARRGRPMLFNDLTALMPWVNALAERAENTNILADISTAIIETTQCWP